jgi:hypothetical protein
MNHVDYFILDLKENQVVTVQRLPDLAAIFFANEQESLWKQSNTLKMYLG